MSLFSAHRYLLQPLSDMASNLRHTRGSQRILAVRDVTGRPNWYSDFLHWLAEEHPDVRARFELKLAGSRIRNWSQYAVCVPWIHGPVKEKKPSLFRKLKALESQCEANRVPVFNRVESLSNAILSRAAGTINSTGCRAARMSEISPTTVDATARTLGYPFFIREDLRHRGPTFMVEDEYEVNNIPWGKYRHPIAIEYIDTRSPDGLYRKYRYLGCGEFGCSLSMMISEDWQVRPKVEMLDEKAIEEDHEYAKVANPYNEELHKVMAALGFNFCAIDYSIAVNGELVIWEANPHPHLPLRSEIPHRTRYTKRGYAVMAAAYLTAAGLEIPEVLADWLPPKAVAA